MIINEKELKEKIIEVLDELSRNDIYIKLQEAHDFVGNVCTWTCDECKCNCDDICKMAEFLANITKYQPSMENVKGEE